MYIFTLPEKYKDMSKSNNTGKATKTLAGSAFTQSASKSNSTLSQVRNVRTGHIITRDSQTGQYTNIGNKPIHGIKVITVFKSASNPSITKETAELAEKAVLAVKNKSSKK